MTTCSICKGKISTFSCNIADAAICIDCCNNVHIGKFSDEWYQFFEEKNLIFNEDSDRRNIDLGNTSGLFNYTLMKCLNCSGCYRDKNLSFEEDSLEILLKGATIEIYKNKFVIGSGFEQLAMKGAYLMEREGCDSSEDFLRLATNYSIAGQYDKALQACQAGIKMCPDPRLHVLSADIQYYHFKDKDIIEELLIAIRLNPALSPAYRLLGVVYSSKGHYGEAIYYFDKARDTFDIIQNKPNDFSWELTYVGLANAYSNLKVYSKVIDNSLLFLKYRPPSDDELLKATGDSFLYASVYHVLAIAYLNEGDLDKALESITRAKDLEPTDPEIRETFGWVKGRMDNYGEVERLREELLKVKADEKLWAAFNQFSQRVNDRLDKVEDIATKGLDAGTKNLEISLKNYELTLDLKAEIQNIIDSLNKSIMTYRDELLQTVHDVEQRAEMLSERILNKIEEFHINLDRETRNRVEERLSDYYGHLWNDMEEISSFLITAEIVYEYMRNKENLDFSPAVIPITKALESLLNKRIYSRIRAAISPADESNQRKFVKIRNRKTRNLLDTVTIGDAIAMLKDNDAINLAKNLNIFKEDISREHYFTGNDSYIYHGSSKKLNMNPTTLKGKLNLVREEYRNKVAHKEGIPLVTAQACRSYMIYGEAFLKELVGKLN